MSRRMFKPWAILVCVFLLAGTSLAHLSFAQDGAPIVSQGQKVRAGQVIHTVGRTGQRHLPGRMVPVTTGTPVYFKQHYMTDQSSGLRLRLRDGSLLGLASVALLSVDDFIYVPTDGFGGKAASLQRGTFNYFSGMGAYESQISLLTPVVTITLAGSAMNGFHLPGVGTVVHIIKGEGSFRASFDEFPLKSGDTVIIGAAGRGGLRPSEIPAALEVEVRNYIRKQLAAVDLSGLPTPPLRQTLAEEGAINLLDVVEQRRRPSNPGPLTAPDWPSQVIQSTAYEQALKEMPLLFEARRKGLLDRSRNRQEKQEEFQKQVQDAEQDAQSALGQMNESEQTQEKAVAQSASGEVIDGLAMNDISQEDMANVVAGASAARPEMALSLAREGMDSSQSLTANGAQAIAEAAAKAAPQNINDLAAEAIKRLPPEEQAQKAKEIVSKMMANASAQATAGKQASGDAGPGALEELPPEAQQAIAEELAESGFQQGGENPDSADDATPSAETRASKPQTPQVGSQGGKIDIIAFLTSVNFLVGLAIVILLAIIGGIFYRFNSAEKRRAERRRRKELEKARRHMAKQAALNDKVKKMGQS